MQRLILILVNAEQDVGWYGSMLGWYDSSFVEYCSAVVLVVVVALDVVPEQG